MEPETDGQHAFDFFHGRWRIHNRCLVKRLQGCDEWEEFPATHECYPVLGGAGNVDHFHGILPNGTPVEGMSVRLFDAATARWRIYWADNRSGEIFPPVVGRLANGEGDFYGDDLSDGTPVRVVYHWRDITPTSARWEQSFSADGEKTWETNWIMLFTRDEE